MKEVVTQGRRLWIKHGQKYLLRNFLRHIKLPYIALELLQIPNGSGLQTKPASCWPVCCRAIRSCASS